MTSTVMLPKPCPPPHFNHHVLCCSGLLTVTERDVETSGRLHVLHQDLYDISFAESGWLFQSLALQGIRRHSTPAMHLRGTWSFIHTAVLLSTLLEYIYQLLTRLAICCGLTLILVSSIWFLSAGVTALSSAPSCLLSQRDFPELR